MRGQIITLFNNVHISRYLFFVSDILDDVAKVSITQNAGIAILVREINKVIPENMNSLSASKVTQWLVSVGYLEEKSYDSNAQHFLLENLFK